MFKSLSKKSQSRLRKIVIFVLVFFAVHFLFSFWISGNLIDVYDSRASATYTDRHGVLVARLPNEQGYYADYGDTIPGDLHDLLLVNEDRFFYFHPGVNPLSIARSLFDRFNERDTASSTITLQLVKVLLGHESDRSTLNKLQEMYHALALESVTTKETVLEMYYNSVFLGNGAQGFTSASGLYFDKAPDELSRDEIVALLATLNSPSTTHPFSTRNQSKAQYIADFHDLGITIPSHHTAEDSKRRRAAFIAGQSSENFFEFSSLSQTQVDTILTIDSDLTETIRQQTYERMQQLFNRNAFNAAVVVIKIPENEVLALVGSPNPSLEDSGYQINMALRERPVGSTIKPFIYAKGFETGLRPYTIVSDREYKYPIGSGYALYPKNYDYTYNGDVTLQYSLANSLNVPTVKVLEHIGITPFASLLTDDMYFTPYRDLSEYGLGIALGELEMSLLELVHFFTIFPHDGELRPLSLGDNSAFYDSLPVSMQSEGTVFEKKFTDLTTAILSDRSVGVDQFGARSNLHLPYSGYAVKTGTGENFRDSLAVGYTKDYLVGVWVGNADFETMDRVSGEQGAGSIWHDVMTLLYNSEYNNDSPLGLTEITKIPDGDSEALTLAEESDLRAKDILADNSLILSPHDGDIFSYEEGMKIELTAPEDVEWFVDDEKIGNGNSVFFSPRDVGKYKITAKSTDRDSSIVLNLKNE